MPEGNGHSGFPGTLYPIFYILLALALMIPLLYPGYFIALDMQFGPNSFSENNFKDFYGSDSNPYGGQLPLKAALAALSDIISIETTEKLVLFSILVLCGICMHFALPKELGVSRYFAGLLYMLNPFVFLRFIVGHWTLLLSYAFFPLAIFYFLDFLKKPNDMGKLAHAALATTLVAVYFHGAAMLLFSYFIVFIFHALKNGIGAPQLKRLALLAILVLIMNLYWILPLLTIFESSGYLQVPSQAYMDDFGAKGFKLPLYQAILTMHGFWRGGFIYTKDIFALWYIPFFAIILLALAGLANLVKKDWAFAVSLAAIFVISFLLALGVNGPLSFLFLSPPLEIFLSLMFRDTQKFVWLLAFCYSVLGAFGADALLGFMNRRFKPSGAFSNIAMLSILAFILAVPILYNYGFFGFIGQVGTTNYPDSWQKAEAMMSGDNASGRVLVLPMHMYMYYSWINGTTKIVGNPQSNFFSMPVVGGTAVETRSIGADTMGPESQHILDIFGDGAQNRSIAELLAPLNISHVFLVNNIVDSPRYFRALNSSGSGMEKLMEGPDVCLFRNTAFHVQDQSATKTGMFYLVLALLLVSVSLSLILLIWPCQNFPAIIAGTAIIFALASFGILGPHHIGAAIILSLLAASCIKLGLAEFSPDGKIRLHL